MTSTSFDERYYINVSDLMKPLPYPRKKHLKNDDEILPIISVETEI